MKNTTDNKKNNFLKGEKPLLEIDKELQSYAKQNNMKLSKNYQNWPERSLSWRDSGIKKLIQIYLEKYDANRFLLWGCAFKDKLFTGRYWWKTEPKAFISSLDWNQIKNHIRILKEMLDKITESQLRKPT